MTRPPRRKNPGTSGTRAARGKEIQKLKKRLKKNPEDEGAFVKLWDVFLESESWEAMAEILETRIQAVTDDKDRVRALIKLGNLFDEKLADPRRAVDTFHLVLTIEPKNRRAIWALAMLYHDLEDWEKVIEIYLLQIELAQSPEEKLAIRAQLAQIYEQRLQQEDQALMEYIRAARLAPQTVRILLNMEKLATRTESFRELLAVYEDVVERIDRIELRIALYLKLARLYSEHLGNEDQSAGYYKRAVELSGGETEKLFSISNIYGEEEEWEELIATYTQLIQHADDPSVKSRLRREISRLYRDGLNDPSSAFFELVRVARYTPDEPALLDDLCELGVACEKHLELAAVLEDMGTRLVDIDAKASLYTRLARLHLDELHNADLARAAISQAIEVAPAHIPAQLVRFDLLQAGKEYELLAQAIESFLSRPDLPEEVIKDQRKRLAQIYEEKLGDRERAVLLYRQTMQEPPLEGAPPPEEREGILEDLYRRQGVWDELISLLARRQSDSSDPDVIGNTALEIAQIQEKKLDRGDLAFFELVRAIKQVPRHPGLLDELFRLARSAGFVTELLAVLDDLVNTMDETQAAMVHQRAGLLLEAIGQSDQALERHQRAADLDPTQDAAYQSLRSTRESAGDFEELVELDLRRASLITDREEKIELLYGAAEILEEKIGNDGRAADVYDRILGLDPRASAANKAIARLRGEAGRVASFEQGQIDQDTSPGENLGPGETSDDVETAPPERLPGEEEGDETGTETNQEDEMAEVSSPLPAPEQRPLPEAEPERKTTPRSPVTTRSDDEEEDTAQVYSPPPEAEPEDRDMVQTVDFSGVTEPDGRVERLSSPLQAFDLESTEPAGKVERIPSLMEEDDEENTDTEHDPFADREPTLVEAAPEAQKQEEPEISPEEEEDNKEPTLVALPPAADPEEPMSAPPETQDVFREEDELELLSEEDVESTDSDEPDMEETEPLEEEATLPGTPADPMDALWQTVREHPGSIEAWEQLAITLEENRSPHEAFDALEEGLKQVPNPEHQTVLYRRMSLVAKTPELQMRLGLLLEDNQHPDDAESSYRSVLREDPAHTGALDGLLRLYEARGSLDRYDAILTRTLKAAKDPTTRRALLMRRATLRANALNRARDALEDLEQLASVEGGDLEALILQEDILERTGQNEELIKAYKRHIELCDEPGLRMDLHTAIAILYENSLANPDRAIVHYRRALKDDPGHLGVTDSLAALLEKKRDWLAAIEVLRSGGDHIQDPEIVSQMHYRAGKILEEQLLRPEEAEAAYRRAVENEAPSVESLAALKDMSRRRADWVELIRLGKQQIAVESDPRAKARVLTELARVWRDKLENEEKGIQCFEMAHDLDADNLEAARVVADARLKTRSHREAHELLEHVAKIGADGEMNSEELAAVHLKLAQTAEALDRTEDASHAYEKAVELAPTDHKILTQYGYHLARCEKWNRAVELYQEILDEYRHKLEPNEVADIHCLAAQGWVKQDRPEEATFHYRKALKANPRHLPALRASVELSRKLGRHGEVVDLLTQLRQLSSSPSTRFSLSVQIGDIQAEQLAQPGEAAKAFQEALEQEPNNIELLEKLRKAWVRSDRYKEAVATLERLAHLAPTDRQRARYYRISGDIERERLDNDGRALDFYLRALRSAPLDKRSHGSAIKILNRMRDWSRLTALYEELLKRLPPPIAGQEDRRLPILTELVELYRYRLEDRRRAIVACEQLLGILPGDIKVREDLARLYEADSRFSDSIRIHRSLIADSPFSVDSYHALRRIYDHQGQRDRTLCMASTLAFLDEANDDELKLLKEHRHALPIPPGRRIDEALYNRLLLFPLARGLLGNMFSFAADFCRSLFVVDHRDFRLKPRDRMSLANNRSKAASTIREALQFLSVPEPEVYGKGVNIKGIMAVNTSPPAVLLSEDAVRRASIAELRFMVGRAVAFSRPENLLAASLSPKQLRNLLEAMVEMVFPGDNLVGVGEEVTSLARKLSKKIPRGKLNRLHQLVSEYREQAEELSIRDWLESVEHTCNRAGFVLCGDLEASVQVLKGARVVSPSGSNRSLIRELIFYSISDDYFELRRALNAAIG